MTFCHPFLLFTGEWSGATGRQYLRARWYNPGSGRFTQVDPFAGVLELPGTQHPYAYGLDNPLRYGDPSGKFVFAAATGFVLVVELAALGAGIATLVRYFTQIAPNIKCGCLSPFEVLYRNTNPISLYSTFMSTFMAGLLAGVFLPLWPQAVISLLGLTGLTATGVGLGLAFIMGAAASVSGSLTGAAVECLLTDQVPDDIYDPASWLSNIVWGGAFGMAGYGIGEYVDSEIIKSGTSEYKNAMTDQWSRNVFEKGIPWGPPKVNGTLQAYDLTTDALYWASVDGPQTLAEAIKWAPSNVALFFEWLSNILDIIMNDDAISIYVEYEMEN